jgi:hypothetical protein
MSTRRIMLAGSALALAAMKVRAQPPEEIVALFVQSAQAMEFATDTKVLLLHGISPQTIFFSDRPERVAGNMTTAHFVPFWSTGKDSFLKNPPNADISVFKNGQLRQIVAELSEPRLDGDTLSYTIVRVLGGPSP